jgi:monofunctional biosynthetic peptidoglycan transglycosylase
MLQHAICSKDFSYVGRSGSQPFCIPSHSDHPSTDTLFPGFAECFRPAKEKSPKDRPHGISRKRRKSKGQHYKIIQIWTPLSKISPYLTKAVLIAEDDKFWKHEGFDYDSIQKAIEKDIQKRKYKFGGSTISQQLAKNLYLSPVKSLWRKTLEAVLTWKLERNLSKRRILELYLNVVEWGEGIFGAEAAARHYFGKASADLSPLEAARLAAVLPNPRKFDPTGNQRYVLNRSRIIYEIMLKRGIVEPEFERMGGAPRENQPEKEPKPAPFPPPP